MQYIKDGIYSYETCFKKFDPDYVFRAEGICIDPEEGMILTFDGYATNMDSQEDRIVECTLLEDYPEDAKQVFLEMKKDYLEWGKDDRLRFREKYRDPEFLKRIYEAKGEISGEEFSNVFKEALENKAGNEWVIDCNLNYNRTYIGFALLHDIISNFTPNIVPTPDSIEVASDGATEMYSYSIPLKEKILPDYARRIVESLEIKERKEIEREL